MRFLFTTSSDISDGVILTFDMKTRAIHISDHRMPDAVCEKLPFPVDTLFDVSCRHRLSRMAISDLVFRHENFEAVIHKLIELDQSGQIRPGIGNTLAIEISVTNHLESIGQHWCIRTLTVHEFTCLLIGQLNQAQFKLLYRKLLEQDMAAEE